jgi:hypothetical protein
MPEQRNTFVKDPKKHQQCFENFFAFSSKMNSGNLWIKLSNQTCELQSHCIILQLYIQIIVKDMWSSGWGEVYTLDKTVCYFIKCLWRTLWLSQFSNKTRWSLPMNFIGETKGTMSAFIMACYVCWGTGKIGILELELHLATKGGR